MKQLKNSNTFGDRSLYTKLRQMYPNAIVSPSFLCAEQVLLNNKSKYDFDIKKNGNESVTEVKLDRNDLFVTTEFTVQLIQRRAAAIGAEILQSYPSPIFAGGGANVGNMEAIYNGSLSLKVGNIVNIEQLTMQQFRRVPRSQTGNLSTHDDNSLDDATYKLPSPIYLHGTMDTKISVEHPTFTGILIAGVTAGFEHRLVLRKYGFLLKGAASQK